jgi:hypothetical protein
MSHGAGASEPPGAITLAELVGQAATLTAAEVAEELGAAFLLLHRVDLKRSHGDTLEGGLEASTADLGFLALPLPALASGEELTVGRSPKCDLVLQHPTVSKAHAAFRREGDQFIIVDKGSRNGTFVNGERLPPNGKSGPVDSRQTVRFGSVALTYVEPTHVLEFGRLLIRPNA